jgi:hypothetical protein
MTSSQWRSKSGSFQCCLLYLYALRVTNNVRNILFNFGEILLLGNIDFEKENNGTVVKSKKDLEDMITLLRLNEKATLFHSGLCGVWVGDIFKDYGVIMVTISLFS